jgi:hypothetical protein
MFACPARVISAIGASPAAAPFVSEACRRSWKGRTWSLIPRSREGSYKGCPVRVNVERRALLRMAEDELVLSLER